MNYEDDEWKGRRAKQKWAVQLKEILAEPVMINGGRRSRSRTHFDEVITQVVNNAVSGDEGAIDQVIKLLLSLSIEEDEAPRMSTEDSVLYIRKMFGFNDPPPHTKKDT